MHIMEGFLPVAHCVGWGAASAPFVALGIRRVQRTMKAHPQTKLLLGAAGAYSFVLSALKMPSVTGSCSHPTVIGLGAVLFGPLVMTGFGFGLSFVPMTMTATGGLPPSQAGLAAGLVNTTRQVGGAIGLAVMGTVAANAASQNNGTVGSVSSALTNGYDRAFLIGACALLVAVGLALLLPGKSPVAARYEAPVTVQAEPDLAELREGEAVWVPSEA